MNVIKNDAVIMDRKTLILVLSKITSKLYIVDSNLKNKLKKKCSFAHSTAYNI